jgi:hypothetical protein
LGSRGNVDGFFSKSDPFVELSAKLDTPGGLTWVVVYRSKHVLNDLNPIWAPISIDLDRLCQGDLDRPLLVSVYDWEKSGKHKSLGRFERNVTGLINAVTPGGAGSHKHVNLGKAFILKKPRASKEFGKIVVTTAIVERGSEAREIMLPIPMLVNRNNKPRPTFVDYLSGGCELELSIAIDFTGSNGDPRRPGTLHYIRPTGELNDYEKCLTSVGSIVARYDSDQRFPVYGFGAKYSGSIQHCFQVGNKPELEGLGEALQAYRDVFKSGLTMSGPTVFSEVIDMAAARSRSAQQEAERIGKQAYQILLILTDGAVSNVELTKQALQRASDAPLSIVIVGVGRADFTNMQFLDDFATNVNNQNQRQPQRDIVQFVEFQRFAHDKSALTRETLEEIPDQVVGYFHDFRGIMPLPPIRGSQINIVASEPDDEDIDLSIDYNSEGDIVLGGDTNTKIPSYDDTQYGTAGAFLLPPVPVPSKAAPYNYHASAPSSQQVLG